MGKLRAQERSMGGMGGMGGCAVQATLAGKRAGLRIGQTLPLEWTNVDFGARGVKPKGKTVYFLSPIV
jgi:hypothetical protein